MSSAIRRLSDTLLRKLSGSPTTKSTFFNDGGDLSVRHSINGLLTWYFAYRTGTGRQVSPERLRLGNYPDLNPEAAREETAQCCAWLVEGENPRYELNHAVQDALAPATVKEALAYWLGSYAKEKRTDHESLKNRINKHIISQTGALPLEKCELRHWLVCFDQMAERSLVSAGFLLQVCKRAPKYCQKRRYAISNVLDDVVVGDVGKKAEVSERVLTNEEFGELLRALDDKILPPCYSALTRLLIASGCRTTESRRSKVQEWDFRKVFWIVSKEHSKTKVTIFRPIPESTLPLVAQLVEQNRHTDSLLSELKGQSLVAEYGGTAHRRINQVLRTLHDIRHTPTTILNDLDVDSRTVEQLTTRQMPEVQ